MKFSLYSKKNRLDEMQEQTMRKIESHGFWLLWGSLLAAWIVQTAVSIRLSRVCAMVCGIATFWIRPRPMPCGLWWLRWRLR